MAVRVDERSVIRSRGFDPYNTADLPHVFRARAEKFGAFLLADIMPTEWHARKLRERFEKFATP